MSEHLLDSTQIGSPLEQMSGKRVTQRVRRDILTDAGSLGETFDYLKRSLPCEFAAAAVEKEDIFGTRFHIHARTVLHPFGYLLHRHHTLLIPLASHYEKSLIGIHLRNLESDKLADTKSAAIHHLNHSTVALTLLLGIID